MFFEVELQCKYTIFFEHAKKIDPELRRVPYAPPAKGGGEGKRKAKGVGGQVDTASTEAAPLRAVSPVALPPIKGGRGWGKRKAKGGYGKGVSPLSISGTLC